MKPNHSPATSPQANKLDVWYAKTSCDRPGLVETCCESWLLPDEILRANRFRKPTSRNQHVVGRGMARRLLGHAETDPAKIRFAEEVHGKPYVVEPESAMQPFNVAHTDGLVLCGVGNPDHTLVGVDVERLGRRTDPELAERYFSPPEIQYLRTQPESQRQDAFLRIWTLKESYIKAIGTGLQTPLSDFAFEQIDSDRPALRWLNPELNDDYQWQFFSFRPQPGFVGAVAVASQAALCSVEIQLQNFDELVDQRLA